MKAQKRFWAWGMAAACLFVFCFAASANPLPGVMWFDQHGNGYYERQRLASTITLDISGGVSTPVLTYFLPVPVVPGDVVITKPGSSDWAEVARFYQSWQGFVMLYYSDGNFPDLGSLMSRQAFLEQGPFGTPYSPRLGQPGQPGQLGPIVFYGQNVSPSAPDAGSTIAMLGLALTVITFRPRSKG